MIQAIKELGEQKLRMESRKVSDLLSILVQNPNQDKRCPYALVIVFRKIKGKYRYSNVRIEQVKESEKYLYRRGASMGPDITPTAKITDDIRNKTFKNKIKGWFKQVNTEDPLISGLKAALIESEELIQSDLLSKWDEVKPTLQRNQSGIITLAIEDDELKYIGDFSVFKELLVQSVKKKYRKIVRANHICSVCGEKREEVYGEAIPIPFYNLDKPGYVAGGFHKENAWRNAPVCLECSLKIEEGKKFLDEHKCLSPRMGGQRYYLIPKFIFGIKEAKEEIIEPFFKTASRPEETLAGKALRRISEDESEILDALGKFKDLLTFNFLFYETPTKSTFKINLFVEDILPSRINTIFNAKSKAEAPEIFKNLKVKKNKYEDVEFRFDTFGKRFTPSRKSFLEVVDKSFRGGVLDQDLLFSWFMRNIRQGFVNEVYLKPSVLQAFVSFRFFKELGILPKSEHLKEGGELMTELKEKAESFFENFSESFATPVHKSVFLLGTLAQKLLDIQHRDRGATPFRKDLKGLKMKEVDFKGLLPKVQNKLEEYGKNYYRSLETLISEYFLEGGKSWNLNTDELNFYFVLGMNLVDEVDKVLGLTKEREVQDVRNNQE